MLTDFRGYAAARLDGDGRPVVLTGPNGAGKTNLLEAISFLAPGRGLRRARLGEIDRRAGMRGPTTGQPARALGGGRARWRRRRARSRSAPAATSERQSASAAALRIDGAPAKSQAALAEHFRLVWLTPQMDRLFLEGGSARRRFLDRLVHGFDPEPRGAAQRL